MKENNDNDIDDEKVEKEIDNNDDSDNQLQEDAKPFEKQKGKRVEEESVECIPPAPYPQRVKKM